MEGKRLLQSISIKKLLSFGAEGAELELQPLNVLIGPNASGKSNLVTAIRFLQAAPHDLTRPVRSDGLKEWLWKGEARTPTAEIEVTTSANASFEQIRHRMAFTVVQQRFSVLLEEILGRAFQTLTESLVYTMTPSGGIISRVEPAGLDARLYQPMPIDASDLKPDQSILSQRRDPDTYPDLSFLSDLYQGIRVYSDWGMGDRSGVREPQPVDLAGDLLEEDASNLALVLSELQNSSEMDRVLEEKLALFYPNAIGLSTRVTGGRVQVYVRERGMSSVIPASRLSDGTLRYLCLLVILCHPEPPPLVCIEEPELGLHPDMLPTVAELLLSASRRTQLIVTTHSDLLVSQFTDQPEAVVVCDRGPNGTFFRRLGPGRLGEEELDLGSQWLKGQIGGTRW
jgi:predicted ATPase